MELDCNCVRDIMLHLESIPYVKTNSRGHIEFVGVSLSKICEKLPPYPQEQVYYTLSKLEEGGYIDMTSNWAGDGLYFCCVNFITYDGHEFLEKIRPPTVWDRTKDVAGKVGSYGLKVIAKIAEGVTEAIIKEQLSLN